MPSLSLSQLSVLVLLFLFCFYPLILFNNICLHASSISPRCLKSKGKSSKARLTCHVQNVISLSFEDECECCGFPCFRQNPSISFLLVTWTFCDAFSPLYFFLFLFSFLDKLSKLLSSPWQVWSSTTEHRQLSLSLFLRSFYCMNGYL